MGTHITARHRVGHHEDLPTDVTQQRRIRGTLSKGNIIGKEHCSEFSMDTIAAIPSVKKTDGSYDCLYNPICSLNVQKKNRCPVAMASIFLSASEVILLQTLGLYINYLSKL